MSTKVVLFSLVGLVGCGILATGVYMGSRAASAKAPTKTTVTSTNQHGGVTAGEVKSVPKSVETKPTEPNYVKLKDLSEGEAKTLRKLNATFKRIEGTMEEKADGAEEIQKRHKAELDKFFAKEVKEMNVALKKRTALVKKLATELKQKTDCFSPKDKEKAKACGKDTWGITEKGEVIKLK